MQNIGRHALLVEDEVLIAATASDSLQELGFEVVEVGSAKAALDYARHSISKLDVAMVDIGLPDLPGEELINELRSLRSDLPVIVATGYGKDALSPPLKNSAGIVVLSKPYDSGHLRAAIDSLKIR